MKAYIYVRVDMDDGTIDRRAVEYESPKDGPWSPALRGLADSYYIGETAKGMVADMVGGPAHTAFQSPASRHRRAALSREDRP